MLKTRIFILGVLLGFLACFIAYPENVFAQNHADTFQTIIQAQTPHPLLGVTAYPDRLNMPYWQTFPTGSNNAITDVPGIKVGHVTLLSDVPTVIRTGVTAVVPDMNFLTAQKGNIANTGLYAGVAELNGNGELTGQGWIHATGILNSPILLTNTWAVGAVDTGAFTYYKKQFPHQWSCELPVVGECWDGVFNTIDVSSVTPDDAVVAIQNAQSGPVLQGRVGAGTGMRSFSLHSGIGSASRVIQIAGKTFILGVLVNTNHSSLSQLNPLLATALAKQLGSLSDLENQDNLDAIHLKRVATQRQGSIIIIVATNLPLLPNQLTLLAQHAVLGIGATGSVMAPSSGDYALAFSTANPIFIQNLDSIAPETSINNQALTAVYTALTEAVVEAQMNALVASHHQ